jgi:cephalosporin hydroxylase
VIQAFHDWYYRSQVWDDQTKWLTVPVAKNPCDLMVLQEIICDTLPTLIIETGTHRGGSALFMATVLDALRLPGRIVSIDIEDKAPAHHERISYIHGSSVDGPRFGRTTLSDEVRQAQRIMVVLDSDHSYEHVTRELDLYAPLVSKGCYLIVEDTNTQGPREALQEWLPRHPNFVVDRAREKFGFTFNPGGFLRRER